MRNLFEGFIEEEFNYIYKDPDIVNWFLETLNTDMTIDMFYDNFDEIKEQVIKDVSNDEWLIQIIHERMDDMLINALKNIFTEAE